MKTLDIILGYKCDISCDFCSQREQKGAEGSTDALLHRLATTLEKHGKTIQKVNVLGGEPLLYPDLLNAVFKLVHPLGCHITLLTHARLLQPHYVDWLNDNGISVCFSVSGITEGAKPLIQLHPLLINRINSKFCSYVVNPGQKWMAAAWTVHQIFQCDIQLSLNEHEWKNFTVDTICDLYAQYHTLGEPEWLHLKYADVTDCDCREAGIIYPDGSFITRAGLYGICEFKGEGCSRMLKAMPEHYPVIKKLFMRMNGHVLPNTNKSHL
jgi:hypothetical protein